MYTTPNMSFDETMGEMAVMIHRTVVNELYNLKHYVDFSKKVPINYGDKRRIFLRELLNLCQLEFMYIPNNMRDHVRSMANILFVVELYKQNSISYKPIINMINTLAVRCSTNNDMILETELLKLLEVLKSVGAKLSRENIETQKCMNCCIRVLDILIKKNNLSVEVRNKIFHIFLAHKNIW